MTPAFPILGIAHCIALEGVDARRFAQAQFAGDVDALRPGQWQWNAWLTAQGRVRALMHLVDAGDGRLLAVLRGGDVETIRATLARYLMRLRASLSVEAFTARGGDPVAAGTARLEGVTLVLGYGTRSLRLDRRLDSPPDGDAREWRLADIRAGWPNLPAGEPEFLPPALGLDRLGAVALDKGCYPGQEIVARLHYRGGHKWHLCRLRGKAPLPRGEVRIPAGAAAVWILEAVSVAGGVEALAAVHVDQAGEINLLGNKYKIESKFDV